MDKSDEKSLRIHILNTLYSRLEDAVSVPDGPVELDLGCGKGGFSIAIARTFPDRTVLSADVMLGRLRKVQKLARRESLANIRLLRVEARHLVSIMIPDSFLDRIHILCPDPWPKHKHKAHRLLSSDFMMQLNRVLKPGGVFHFSTDDAPYMGTVSGLVAESGLFEPAGKEAIEDVLPFKTEFETDWLAMGRKVPHAAWRAVKA